MKADNKKQNTPFDICVVAYSSDQRPEHDHYDIIVRCITSILKHTPPEIFRLTIGCNNISARVMAFVAEMCGRPNVFAVTGTAHRDRRNRPAYPKYPLMREMFRQTTSRWVVWFDDDSYVTEDGWLPELKQAIAKFPDVAQFGKLADVPWLRPAAGWIENASWSRPEVQHEKKTVPDGSCRIVCPYILGGFYALRRDAIEKCNIPDPRLFHNGGDWTTGLALNHQGFKIRQHINGVAINQSERRGIHDDVWISPGVAARLQSQHIDDENKTYGQRSTSIL